jgi:hypothetical protein
MKKSDIIIRDKREEVYSLTPSSSYCTLKHGASSISGFSSEDNEQSENVDGFIFPREYLERVDHIFR